MEKFIKNQIEIEAEEYTGAVEQLVHLENDRNLHYKQGENGDISILTRNGTYTDVEIGDYIVIGINGDFNSVKGDDFHKLYSIKTTEDFQNNDESINKKNCEIENKSNLIKYIVPPLCIQYLLVFISLCIFLIIQSCVFDLRYKKIVEEANKSAIEKASNELLKSAQVEAESIINTAKENAKKEADITFRNEMKRLTEEKIGK